MSGLFSKPEIDAPTVVPPAPTEANSQGEMDLAARQMARRLSRGRSATMLTGGAGVPETGTTAKTLLGR